MYSLAAYGLCIHSDFSLPELLTIEAAPDVVVRLAPVDRVPAKGVASGRGWWATADEVCLFYEEFGAVLLREGREMLVDPVPDLEEQSLCSLILGAPIAMLLHQRGLLVLHASAVDLGGSAIVLVGDPRAGKSTTAAALQARGGGAIADDVVAVDLQHPRGPLVLPAFPQLKLWPQVLEALGRDPEALARVLPDADKRVFRAVDRFPQAPLPLECIYVLSRGTRSQIDPFGFQDALIQLVRHSYAVHLLDATGTTARHFRQCATLASSVPIKRLERQQSLASLSELAELIETDGVRSRSENEL